MGQYHIIVNLDRQECILPSSLDSGLKAWEQIANLPSTPQALYVLLMCSNGRSGRDLRAPEPQGERIYGRWTGERIAVVGDYAEDNGISGIFRHAPSQIYRLRGGRHVSRHRTAVAANPSGRVRRNHRQTRRVLFMSKALRHYGNGFGSMRLLTHGVASRCLSSSLAARSALIVIRVKRKLNSTDLLETLADVTICQGTPDYVQTAGFAVVGSSLFNSSTILLRAALICITSSFLSCDPTLSAHARCLT
jgi:hypothetical protein